MYNAKMNRYCNCTTNENFTFYTEFWQIMAELNLICPFSLDLVNFLLV